MAGALTVVFYMSFTGALDNISDKVVLCLVYLCCFPIATGFYIYFIDEENKPVIKKLEERAEEIREDRKKMRENRSPSDMPSKEELEEREEEFRKREEELKIEKTDNPYTKISNEMRDVFKKIDFPVFCSFLLFTIVHFSLNDSTCFLDIIKHQSFGYGGVIFHMFLETILFLNGYAGEYFETPMPEFRPSNYKEVEQC